MDPLFRNMEHHNDEELLQMAKDLFQYASYELQDLRKNHSRTPEELVANENFYKNLIAASSEFLMQTNNWYPPYERTNQRCEEISRGLPSREWTDPSADNRE